MIKSSCAFSRCALNEDENTLRRVAVQWMDVPTKNSGNITYKTNNMAESHMYIYIYTEYVCVYIYIHIVNIMHIIYIYIL